MSSRVIEAGANIVTATKQFVREKGSRLALAGVILAGGNVVTADRVSADIPGIIAVKACNVVRPGVQFQNKRDASTPPATVRVFDTAAGSPKPEQGSVAIASGELRIIPVDRSLFGPGKTVEARVDGEAGTATVSMDCANLTTSSTAGNTPTTPPTTSPNNTVISIPGGETGLPESGGSTTPTTAQPNTSISIVPDELAPSTTLPPDSLTPANGTVPGKNNIAPAAPATASAARPLALTG